MKHRLEGRPRRGLPVKNSTVLTTHLSLGSPSYRSARALSEAWTLTTKVGPPERDKTDGPQELNDGWVRGHSAPQRNILKNETAEIANPVRAGFDQFLVQPHLEFCRAVELNLSESKTVTPPK